LIIKSPWIPGFINNRQHNVMLSRISLLLHSCSQTVLNKFAGLNFVERTLFRNNFCWSHLFPPQSVHVKATVSIENHIESGERCGVSGVVSVPSSHAFLSRLTLNLSPKQGSVSPDIQAILISSAIARLTPSKI
jgi:hypothetical protein